MSRGRVCTPHQTRNHVHNFSCMTLVNKFGFANNVRTLFRIPTQGLIASLRLAKQSWQTVLAKGLRTRQQICVEFVPITVFPFVCVREREQSA